MLGGPTIRKTDFFLIQILYCCIIFLRNVYVYELIQVSKLKFLLNYSYSEYFFFFVRNCGRQLIFSIIFLNSKCGKTADFRKKIYYSFHKMYFSTR